MLILCWEISKDLFDSDRLVTYLFVGGFFQKTQHN